MGRGWIVVVVVVGAGVFGAGIGAPGSAESGSEDESGVVIATGQLTDERGRPQAGTVSAYALPVGGPRTQTLRKVASARADADGRFELRTSNPRLLARLSRAKGSTDLTVHGFTSSGFGATVFSSTMEHRDGALAATVPGREPQSPTKVPAIKVEAVRETRTIARAAHPCEDYGDVGAPKYHRRDTYKRPVVIGELNNAYPDTRASFAYGERADSWVSVGLKLGADPFKFGGWSHVGNSRDVEIGKDDQRGPYARRLRSNFYFEKARIHVCAAPGAGSVYTEVKVSRWSGGLSSRAQGGTIHVCYGGNDYGRGTHFTRDRNKAVQWDPGVEIAWPGGGVELRSTSGFSRWVRVQYDFGRQVNRHRICGSGGRDETFAGRIFSGAGRPPT